MKKFKLLAIALIITFIPTIGGFSVLATDKSALEALYQANASKVQGDYFGNCFVEFDDARTHAEAVINNVDASQAEIDAAFSALEAAVNGLVIYKSDAVYVSKDTYVQNSGSVDYGAAESLAAKMLSDTTASTGRRIFLGFSLQDSWTEYKSVKLRIFVTRLGSNAVHTDTGIYVHTSFNTNWLESGMTWSTKPAIDAQPIASYLEQKNIFETAGEWFEFDVTDYVRAQKTLGANAVTFALCTKESGSAMLEISSKENTDGNKARLVFEQGSKKSIGELMQEDVNAIDIASYINDLSVSGISQSLKTLPSTGGNGYDITWSSSHPGILSDAGEIVSVPSGDTEVTMTATVISDGVAHSKSFVLTVLDTTALGPVDKAELTALYNANSSKTDVGYSEGTYAAFQSAMSYALQVINNANALQTEVDAALQGLIDAVGGLVLYTKTVTTVVKDTYVQNSGSTDYGAAATLTAKQPHNTSASTGRRIYLGFNTGSFDADITTATLRVFVTQCGSNASYADTEAYIHTSTGTSWSESGMTWSNKPTISTAYIATQKPGNIFEVAGRWVEFDVSEYVRAQKAAGASAVTFTICTNDSGSAFFSISSKENTNGNKAELVVEGGSNKSLLEMKQADLDAIDILDYINDLSADRITQSLKALPTTGSEYGYSIVWTSDNTSLLGNDGQIIKRPAANTEVTMTASITSDGITVSREFPLTVLLDMSSWTDEQIIQAELDELHFADFCSQDPSRIIGAIALPAGKYQDGAEYTWSVTNTTAANLSGYTVTFTPQNNSETNLSLIVTATLNGTSLTKAFPITVIRKYGDNLLLTGNAAIKASSGTATTVAVTSYTSYWESKDTDLQPTITFTFASPVTITSALLMERSDAIRGFTISTSQDGTAWKAFYTGTTLGDMERNLIVLSEAVTTKMVRITITDMSGATASLYSVEFFNAIITDAQKIAYDANELSLPAVTASNLTLPATGTYGSTIVWTTSNAAYITASGVVSRQQNQSVSAVLTATIKNGSETIVKSFTVKVSPYLTSGTGGGSSSGAGSGTVAYLPPADETVSELPNYQTFEFADVAGSHWAYAYVMDLAGKGIISKAENYRPSDGITREEFVKMLVIVSGISSDSGAELDFTDVDPNAWYYSYVKAAYNSGLVKGINEDEFGVGVLISRQDMAVMVYRLLDMLGLTTQAGALNYGDTGDISAYALEAVAQLAQLKIMNGNEMGMFIPSGNTTRAEAAKILSVLDSMTN